MMADKQTEGEREGCRAGGKLQTILAVGLIPIERNDLNDSNRYIRCSDSRSLEFSKEE